MIIAIKIIGAIILLFLFFSLILPMFLILIEEFFKAFSRAVVSTFRFIKRKLFFWRDFDKARFAVSMFLAVFVVFLFIVTPFSNLIKGSLGELWTRLWGSLWSGTAHSLFESWSWTPTHSVILNIILGAIHVILIVFIVPAVLFLIFYIFIYFYLTPFLCGWCGIGLGYLVGFLINIPVWLLRDIFRANIGSLSYEFFRRAGAVFGGYGGFTFLIGLFIYNILPIFWKLIFKRTLIGIGVAFFGDKKEEEVKAKMKKEKATILENPDITIPKVFNEKQIESDLKKYRSNTGILKAYFSGLAEQFRDENEIKVIRTKMDKLNIAKEYFNVAYELKVTKAKLDRVDREQELEEKKLKWKEKAVDLEGEVALADLEMKLAKIRADKAEVVSGKDKDQVKEAVRKIKDKVISVAEAKQEIRKKYPEEAEEMIELLDQELAEGGHTKGGLW